jgi:hypothetical protein
MPRARAGRPWFLGAVVLVLGSVALIPAAQPWSSGKSATSRGVVELDNTRRGLVVWRVEPR